MVIVSVGHIENDSRLFCKSWKAMPFSKFDSSALSPIDYVFSNKDIPSDFSEKYAIYYIDNSTGTNKLVKAYEYESKWNSMQFIVEDVVATNGRISDDVIVQTLQASLKEAFTTIDTLQKSVAVLPELVNRLKACEDKLDAIIKANSVVTP